MIAELLLITSMSLVGLFIGFMVGYIVGILRAREMSKTIDKHMYREDKKVQE